MSFDVAGAAAPLPRVLYRRRSDQSPKIAARVTCITGSHELGPCARAAGIPAFERQRTSDWGAVALSAEQLAYAASDVLHLHALWARLEALLAREARLDLAEACFAFLPARARLDLLGYEDPDIFHH